MRPILFEVFGVPVYSYGFALALAFAVSTAAAALASRRHGIDPVHVIDLGMITCVLDCGGSSRIRLAELVLVPRTSRQHIRFDRRQAVLPRQACSRDCVGILYCRFRGIDRWLMADLAAPYIALGYSIVRMGCFLEAAATV